MACSPSKLPADPAFFLRFTSGGGGTTEAAFEDPVGANFPGALNIFLLR